jgi:hypothetical protein
MHPHHTDEFRPEFNGIHEELNPTQKLNCVEFRKTFQEFLFPCTQNVNVNEDPRVSLLGERIWYVAMLGWLEEVY